MAIFRPQGERLERGEEGKGINPFLKEEGRMCVGEGGTPHKQTHTHTKGAKEPYVGISGYHTKIAPSNPIQYVHCSRGKRDPIYMLIMHVRERERERERDNKNKGQAGT